MRNDLVARTAPALAIVRSVGASILAIAMMLILWAASNPAAAQIACTTRGEVAERLAGEYAEAPVAAGLTSSGGVIEVFASGDGTSWTIVLTKPEGTSCLVAAGEAWTVLPIKVTVKGPDV